VNDYARQKRSAARMIAKAGQLVKWRVIRDEAPVNPSEPWKPTNPVTPVEHDVTICFLTVDKDTYETLSYMAGGEVPMGAAMGLMDAVNFEPSLKDVVIRDGKELRLFNVEELNPNGQTILYTMVFR